MAHVFTHYLTVITPRYYVTCRTVPFRSARSGRLARTFGHRHRSPEPTKRCKTGPLDPRRKHRPTGREPGFDRLGPDIVAAGHYAITSGSITVPASAMNTANGRHFLMTPGTSPALSGSYVIKNVDRHP